MVFEGNFERITQIFLVAMRRRETPVSIPNTMVKPQTADGTMLATAWESRRLPGYGGLAQLGERLPCKQEVTSSNLVFSTRPEGRMYFENCIQ